jgi:chloride intracellular channel protein 2
MVLYCKAGPDGVSIGDCPFCHAVRLVLEEKNLPYQLRPAVPETKPAWLVEFYGGKMPALQHGKECYVESDVICEYLDFFFQSASRPANQKPASAVAATAVDGFFPAVAAYLKHTVNGDATDSLLCDQVRAALQKLETHLSQKTFLRGEHFTIDDCKLVPKLYHLGIGLAAFKENAIDISTEFPAVQQYIVTSSIRPSFAATVYPASTVEWGWGNARKSQHERF